MIKLFFLTTLSFVAGVLSLKAQDTLKNYVVSKQMMLDLDLGRVDTQILKNKVKSVTCYGTTDSSLNPLSFKLLSITDYNKQGQITNNINGTNLVNDSIEFNIAYKYSHNHILCEADLRLYRNYFQQAGIFCYDDQGNYLGLKFRLENDDNIYLISKYSHNKKGNLIRVDRYFKSGELAVSEPVYDTDRFTIAIYDSVLVKSLSNNNSKTYKQIGWGSNQFTRYDYSKYGICLKQTKYLRKADKDSILMIVTYHYNEFNKLEKITCDSGSHKNVCFYRRLYVNDSVPLRDSIFNIYNNFYAGYINEVKTYNLKGHLIKDEQYPPNNQFFSTIIEYNEKGLETYHTAEGQGYYGNRPWICKYVYEYF